MCDIVFQQFGTLNILNSRCISSMYLFQKTCTTFNAKMLLRARILMLNTYIWYIGCRAIYGYSYLVPARASDDAVTAMVTFYNNCAK